MTFPTAIPAKTSAILAKQRTLLRPRSGWQPAHLGELWNYRELLFILAMRDVRVRYKQTYLGVAWAIIQPFFSMILFTIVFARMAKMSTDGIPPPLFYFSGSVIWQLFSNSLTQAGNSLVGNRNLITKVYFPRLVIPIAAVITGLIDFAIASLVLLGLMIYYGYAPGLRIFALPGFVLLAFVAAVAAGLWLSALNVEFRDIRYIIPFLTQFWFYATPVVYPSSYVTNPLKRAIFGLNPMSGVVEGFRWCLFDKSSPPGPMVGVSVATILLLLVGGLFYFRRMEKTFADLI